MGQLLRVGLVGTIFAAGYVCGSVSHHPADAQLGELGKAAMEKAGGSGGDEPQSIADTSLAQEGPT